MRKVLVVFLLAAFILSAVAGCGAQNANNETSEGKDAVTSTAGSSQKDASSVENTGDQVFEIEMVDIESEYIKQNMEIWALYEKDHPNVKIKMVGWETGQDAVNEARIAAGDPPHIWETDPEVPITKDKYYSFLVNLLEIDYPYFDKFTYDVKNRWSEITGVPDYLPCFSPFLPVDRVMVYHRDEMDSLGLKPKENIKTMDDFTDFLRQLKKAVDSSGGKYQYVLDTAWLPYEIDRAWVNAFTTAFSSYDEMNAVWDGRVRWDDIEKNPYAKTFRYFKQLYDEGILPKNWWTRQWEQEFETSFIAKKSILTFHGPWIWSKTLAQNPDAKLDGFPLPANKEGYTFHEPISGDWGMAIFKAYENKPIFKEIVDAFTWFNSPEVIKMRCENQGRMPAMDLSDLGTLNIKTAMYQNVVKPLNEGFFGNSKFDMRPWGDNLVNKFKTAGTPDPTNDDALAAMWGAYMKGELTLEEFMKRIQTRWEAAYKIAK